MTLGPDGRHKGRAKPIYNDSTQIRAVLDTVREFKDGLTCDDLESLLDLKHQTCSARVYDLHTTGRIVDSGRKRATRSGTAATVWIHPFYSETVEVLRAG